MVSSSLSCEADAQRRARPDRAEVPESEAPSAFSLQSIYTPGGLTADRAATLAAEAAPSTESARAEVERSEAAESRARLGFLPRANVTARYARVSDVDNEPLVEPPTAEEMQTQRMLLEGVEDPETRLLLESSIDKEQQFSNYQVPVVPEQYFLRADLSYPISDVFLTLLPAYRSAKHMTGARELQLEAERAKAALRGREAYYAYVRARGALEVARATVAHATENRRAVDALVRAGAAPPLERRRMEAMLARTQVEEARARAAVATTEHALRKLLDLEPDAPIEIGEELSDEAEPVREDRARLITEALDSRPELEALELVVEAQSSAASVSAGARWPRVVVSAGAEYARPHRRAFPPTNEWQPSWDVGVGVQWSPNTAAEEHRQYQEAGALARRARADLDAMRDAVEMDVVRAYEERAAADRRIEAARLGVTAAEAAYEGRAALLRTRGVVVGDLLEAESDLARARMDLLDALIDQRLAAARLQHAVAGSLEKGRD